MKNATPKIDNGVHELNRKVNAIVSEYGTKTDNEFGFEAPKQFVDIQALLYGEERAAYLSIDKLKQT